jgi:hypothetical protein
MCKKKAVAKRNENSGFLVAAGVQHSDAMQTLGRDA